MDDQFPPTTFNKQNPETHDRDQDRSPRDGVTRRDFLRTGAAGAAAGVLAGSGLSYPAQALSRSHGGAMSTPLILEKQRSFAFGGTVITSPEGDTFHGDHGFARFQSPPSARDLPLVMWHGGGQFMKTWESTPDGRDGYQQIFTRRGWATYLIDQPRRGEAGRTTEGTTIPDAEPDESNLFTIFRLGVWTPPDPKHFFPNVHFSKDPKVLNQYWRQITPDTGPDGGATGVGSGATIATDAVATLFDKIGPAILITHSASGILGWQTALKTKNIKAIVSYEPTVFLFPEGDPAPPPGFAPAIAVPPAEFMKLTKSPIQIVFGDNIGTSLTGIFGIDLWVRSVPAARAFADTVNAYGGDAEVLLLPDAGLFGNTHFPFSDLNNIKVANLLSKYLREKGLDRR